ncbi:unnamed protein product [Diatraea saccharalis]|uniref:Uncharacterized protein n=1 Tax=Diatraea saccharalis TaxID=40085 RepID=A0A9N9RE65_9NEOP|nr:unnamed protein product [Diatraea saccharalis]
MLDLPIDAMSVNTSLAENYFKQNNSEFSGKKYLNYDDAKHEEVIYTDGFNNIITVQDFEYGLDIIEKKERPTSDVNTLDFKFMNLKKLIEDNTNLISQIEFLIRNTPINEVQNFDIKLILQNILYNTTVSCISQFSENCLFMDYNTPLANLGCVAQILRHYTLCVIVSRKSTAAVCHLFTELCHKAGLAVELIFCEDEYVINSVNYVNMTSVKSIMSGCVGVISENADIESAVDTLLETTVRYPWKLQRVLVQESVYSTFKKAMHWKTKDVPSHTTQNTFCTETFHYKEKTFLIDCTASQKHEGVYIEAYRTTKELISLLKKYNNFFMSLWTDSIVESSEISHHATADVIWINNFGLFDGPPLSSQAVYGTICSNYNRSTDTFIYVNKLWKKQQEDWLKLPFHERCNRLNYVLCENLAKNGENLVLQQLKNGLKDWKCDSVCVYVDNGVACVCTAKPIDSICYKNVSRADASTFTQIIRDLALGSPVVVEFWNDEIASFQSEMSRIGVPLFLCSDDEFADSVRILAVERSTSRTKVVYSNFGTIFAN